MYNLAYRWQFRCSNPKQLTNRSFLFSFISTAVQQIGKLFNVKLNFVSLLLKVWIYFIFRMSRMLRICCFHFFNERYNIYISQNIGHCVQQKYTRNKSIVKNVAGLNDNKVTSKFLKPSAMSIESDLKLTAKQYASFRHFEFEEEVISRRIP